MNHRLHASPISLLALFLLSVSAPGAAPGAQPVQTVSLPYALRDESGASLIVNADGSVMDPQGEVLGAGGQLFVGNEFQYAPDNPQATFDARRNELAFPPVPAQGQAQGLTVSRRVSLDGRGGWWRFVEVFENAGGAPVRTQVRVHFELSNGIQAAEQVADARGVGAVGAAVSDGNRFVALLAGRRTGTRVRPQVAAQAGAEGADLRYDVEVPARRTLAVVHFMSVRATLNDALDFVRSAKDADLLQGLPPEVLKALANFPTGRHLVGDLDVLRGEMFDVVELRGGDVYKGTLRDKTFPLQTPYGLLDLPAERVVAMVTLGQFRPTQLLVTADGEVFGGTLKSDALKLELSSGQVTAVPLAGVRRFGYRRRPGEGDEPVQFPGGRAVLVLRAGDRVAVEPPASPVAVATCYGVLRLDPRTVASVALQSDEHGVHAVRLTDGSRFAGVVLQERFDLKPCGAAAGAARAVSFPAASVERLQLAPEPEEPGDGAAQLALGNGDVLACGLTGRIVLETGFDAIEVEAEGLRGLRRGGGGVAEQAPASSAAPSAGELQLTLWDGTTLSGRVRGDALDCTLKCGAAVKVPVAMVRQYTQPAPRPPPQVVGRIKAVVAELNADDWKLRDRAAAQLVSIGPAAAAVLRELREGQPPEVRQRIDQILSGFGQGGVAPKSEAPDEAK